MTPSTAQFSAQALLDSAIEHAGVDNFGDVSFTEGLAILVNSINNNDNLIENRLYMIRQQFLRMLTNRLWRVQDFRENPEILDQNIGSPTVIISFPRTGSTKLQQVLEAMDHFHQAPCWQLFNPARRPEMADSGRALRHEETKQYYEWRGQASPELHKLRPIYPDRADEETEMFYETFQYVGLGMHYCSREYVEWTLSLDPGELYDYLLTQLKYLHWQFNRENARPWLLKSPVYMGNEHHLSRMFPGGFKTIYLHRSPAEILPSAIKVSEAHTAVHFDLPPQSKKARSEMLAWTTGTIKSHMQWRDDNPSAEILDLSFDEVTNESVNTCKKVCDFVGAEFTDDMKHRVNQWDKEHPRYRRGKSEYSLNDYDLNETQVNEAFSEYLNRFGNYVQN